jgi:hypothetical protein
MIGYAGFDDTIITGLGRAVIHSGYLNRGAENRQELFNIVNNVP